MDHGREWAIAKSGGGRDFAAGMEKSERTYQRKKEWKLTRLGH